VRTSGRLAVPIMHKDMQVHVKVTQANIFLILALDMPFMLLPFRPTSDPSAARTFIRNFFDKGQALHGEYLTQELRLTEPMVNINNSWSLGLRLMWLRFCAALQSGAGLDFRVVLCPGMHTSSSVWVNKVCLKGNTSPQI